jgi:hypothetical protein
MLKIKNKHHAKFDGKAQTTCHRPADKHIFVKHFLYPEARLRTNLNSGLEKG